MRAWSLAVALLAVAVALTGCVGSGGLFGSGQAGPRDFLSGKTYRKWIVEVDIVGDAAPPSGLLDFVKGRLQSVADKPDGIEFRIDSTKPARGGAWTDKDILQLDDATRDLDTEGSTATLHLLFLDGHYSTDGVLGVTYRQGSSSGPIAIFSQSITTGCGLLCLSGTTPAFRAVTVHEFGHAMGLVNNGIPMVHDHEAKTCNASGTDQPDKGHSSNDQSVMYCAAETNGIFNLKAPPTDYDAADRADFCNAGGKC